MFTDNMDTRDAEIAAWMTTNSAAIETAYQDWEGSVTNFEGYPMTCLFRMAFMGGMAHAYNRINEWPEILTNDDVAT